MPGCILGFGLYLPDRVMSNPELAGRLDCTPEWIYKASGIEERRIAAEAESVADMSVLAAKNCLAAANMNASDLKLVIVSSGSSEQRFPGPASSVAHQLGIGGVPCLDLPIASAGSLFGLSLASRLAADQSPILIVAGEKMSPVALKEPLDKNVAILFGDGAGACVVSQRGSGLIIVDSVLHSDGAYAHDLRLDFNGVLSMDGFSVIMQASRKMPGAISELLQLHGMTASDIDVFLVHQANQNLLLRVAKTLGVPGDRFYSNVARYGNTSSASMLIAAAEFFRENDVPAGTRICFAAFGAGFHWGALLAEKS